jgi:hypothetical protein
MGIFLERLKFAEIKPLLKEGCKRDPLNYGPISLLTSFSKMFEKIILSRLYHHVHEYHILAGEQFGFRRQSSTNKASYVLETLNKQKNCRWNFLRFKKGI